MCLKQVSCAGRVGLITALDGVSASGCGGRCGGKDRGEDGGGDAETEGTFSEAVLEKRYRVSISSLSLSLSFFSSAIVVCGE